MKRYCLFDCDAIHVFTLTSVAACVVCPFFDALPDLTSHFVFCGFQCICVVRVVAQLCFCGVEFVLLQGVECVLKTHFGWRHALEGWIVPVWVLK